MCLVLSWVVATNVKQCQQNVLDDCTCTWSTMQLQTPLLLVALSVSVILGPFAGPFPAIFLAAFLPPRSRPLGVKPAWVLSRAGFSSPVFLSFHILLHFRARFSARPGSVIIYFGVKITQGGRHVCLTRSMRLGAYGFTSPAAVTSRSGEIATSFVFSSSSSSPLVCQRRVNDPLVA